MVSQYWKVILGLGRPGIHAPYLWPMWPIQDLYHDPFGETSISPHRSYPCGDRTSVVESVGIGWNPGTETVPVAKKHIQISDFCWQISNLLPVSTRVCCCFRDTSVVSEFWYLHAPFRGVFHSRNPKVLMKIPCWSSAPSSMTVPSSKPSQENTAGSWSRSQKKVWLTKKALGCSGDMDMFYVYCLVISLAIDWCIHGILLYHLFKISWNLCKYVCIEIERGREKERKRERGR